MFFLAPLEGRSSGWEKVWSFLSLLRPATAEKIANIYLEIFVRCISDECSKMYFWGMFFLAFVWKICICKYLYNVFLRNVFLGLRLEKVLGFLSRLLASLHSGRSSALFALILIDHVMAASISGWQSVIILQVTVYNRFTQNTQMLKYKYCPNTQIWAKPK